MEYAILIGALALGGIIVLIHLSSQGDTKGRGNLTSASQQPAASLQARAKPYQIGDSLADDEHAGKVEAVSADGRLAAGILYPDGGVA